VNKLEGVLMSSFVKAVFIVSAFIITSSFAGTGGSEIASWYTDISNALQGTWGKIGAVAFIVLSIMILKNGSILGGAFLFFLGLSIGTIPDIVDSTYTLTI